MTRSRDFLTEDMFPYDTFAIPTAPAPNAASMYYAAEVATLLGRIFADSGKDRYEIAAEMSRLTGREVSKYMLDAWTSEGRVDYNIPFYLVAVAEVACSTHVLSAWLAEKRGARLAIGPDALNAEYGKLKAQEERIKKRRQALEKVIGRPA